MNAPKPAADHAAVRVSPFASAIASTATGSISIGWPTIDRARARGSDMRSAYCAAPVAGTPAEGQLVGARNYEVGHLVLGVDTPGTSYGSSAGSEYRAYGCSGSATPTGDGFAVARLAHELGHQLGAGATFDGVSCAEERNPESASEPGSGVSVMGGAGTCGTDDLQARPDPWFTSVSLEEIGWYVTGQGFVPDDAASAGKLGTTKFVTEKAPFVALLLATGMVSQATPPASATSPAPSPSKSPLKRRARFVRAQTGNSPWG